MSTHSIGPFENKKGMSVDVKNNNVEAAIRILGRKIKQEGLVRELRRRQAYEQPSAMRRRKHSEAVARAKKLNNSKEDI